MHSWRHFAKTYFKNDAVGPRRGFSIGPVIGSQVRNRLFAGGKDRGGVRLPWSVEHVNPVGSREFPALAERPLP